MYTDILKNLWAITAIVLIVRIMLFVVLSLTHFLHSRYKHRAERLHHYAPHVSVLVPAYNEEQVLANCIEGLLNQTYQNYDIVIINDGSKDRTALIGERLAEIYKERIILINKDNGGKASALNYGLARASGEIVITVDADSILTPEAITYAVRAMRDPSIVAVCGNIKVANQDTLFGKHQAIEYFTGLNLQRRTFALLSCVQVISGALGAFRKDALISIGGYSSDTLVEDMDLTIALAKSGQTVGYADRAIAYTEAPERLSDFMKQRHRWMLGTFQILGKYKGMIFNPRYGMMGLVGLPYFLLSPIFDVLLSLSLLWSFVDSFIYHPMLLLGILSVLVVIQILMLIYAILIDRENVKIVIGLPTYILFYQTLLAIIIVRALFAYVTRAKVGWNKLERMGKNVLSS